MENFTEIKKTENISYDEFIEEHVKKGIPIVFKNASSSWKSNKIFTPEFFSEKFGDYTTNAGGIDYTINEILDITAKSTPENPAPYPIIFEIPKQMPEFLELVQPLHMNYATPNWFNSKVFPYGKYGNATQLFFGGRGNQYSLHKDFFHTNAWITQLYGEKKFFVFPGNQDEYLYPGKESFSRFLSPINVMKPDFDKYPEYKKATVLDIVVQPGETIFIPNGLWHTTFSPGQNISLIFDQLNKLNYDAWKKDMFELKINESKLKAFLTLGFATVAGSVCKTAELTGSKF